MSSSAIPSLDFAGEQIIIYVGIVILIVGIIGGFLIPIVFLSLRTFRQNSCAFYLTIMSIVNIGQILTGLLSRIMTTGFNIDWTQKSRSFCKFRFYCFQVCALISMSCMCLATIDQYLATCSRPRWQQWSNITVAHRLSGILIFFWIVYNIPTTIFFNHVVSTATGKVSCVITNNIFSQYTNYFMTPVLGKFLPVFITLVFGFLAYQNVQQLTHRTLPLVRRELDKQLTVMVLLLVVFGSFTIIPYGIVTILQTIPSLTQNPIISSRLQFALTLSICLTYTYFASPFYIFICVSDRFRRQLIYVLFDIYLNRWRQRRIAVNQVMPKPDACHST